MEQDELLLFTANALDRLAIRYALVGSFASGIWGEARFTQDIDLVVELAEDQVDSLCAAYPEDEFYVSPAAVRDAVAARRPFNVIHPRSGNKVDFMMQGTDPWQLGELDRAIRISLGDGCEISVASPTDVIIGKLAYFAEGRSDKHLRDIVGILRISGANVDRALVDAAATSFALMSEWCTMRNVAM